MKKVIIGGLAAASLLATASIAATTSCLAGDDLCEPARLTGKAGERLAQGGPMMGGGGEGMMKGRGMMRERMRGMMKERGMGPGMMRGRMMGNPVRHRQVMMGGGVPAPYAGMKNPLEPTKENIEAGRKLYEENCASCHGPKGLGDGEAGKELNPPPANIAFVIDKPIATDGFLMWTISEGGEKLKTAMPAFKDVLSEKERWQLILFLRNGLGR